MITPPPLPSLSGLGWSVHKKPIFSTIVASHVSGREVRDALYQNPIWQFELTVDGMDSTSSTYAGLGGNSLQSLMGFFLQCQGQYLTFLYTDPTDNAVGGTYWRPSHQPVHGRHCGRRIHDHLHLCALHGRVSGAGRVGHGRLERLCK